jgi:hypothetical protein
MPAKNSNVMNRPRRGQVGIDRPVGAKRSPVPAEGHRARLNRNLELPQGFAEQRMGAFVAGDAAGIDAGDPHLDVPLVSGTVPARATFPGASALITP